MIFSIVLPTALPGMITGVLLAVARAAGETAPLLFTAGATLKTSFGLGSFMNSLPVQIYSDVTSPTTSVVTSGLGGSAHAGHDDPDPQPHRPPRLAKEPPCMTSTRPPTNVADADPQASPDPQAGAGASSPASDQAAGALAAVDPAKQPEEKQGKIEAKRGLAVRLEQLRAFYGNAEQVKGLDLEFHPNQVTAIIGPSGCGKSTMVRCINRMHEEIPGAHAEGRVMLDGSGRL